MKGGLSKLLEMNLYLIQSEKQITVVFLSLWRPVMHTVVSFKPPGREREIIPPAVTKGRK